MTDFDEELYNDFVLSLDNLYRSTNRFMAYSGEVGSVSEDYSDEALLRSFSHMADMYQYRQELDEFLESLPIEVDDTSEILDSTYYFGHGVQFQDSDEVEVENERESAAVAALTHSYEDLRAYSFMVNGDELFIDLPDLTRQKKQSP